jgi:hypothetical protein
MDTSPGVQEGQTVTMTIEMIDGKLVGTLKGHGTERHRHRSDPDIAQQGLHDRHHGPGAGELITQRAALAVGRS